MCVTLCFVFLNGGNTWYHWETIGRVDKGTLDIWGWGGVGWSGVVEILVAWKYKVNIPCPTATTVDAVGHHGFRCPLGKWERESHSYRGEGKGEMTWPCAWRMENLEWDTGQQRERATENGGRPAVAEICESRHEESSSSQEHETRKEGERSEVSERRRKEGVGWGGWRRRGAAGAGEGGGGPRPRWREGKGLCLDEYLFPNWPRVMHSLVFIHTPPPPPPTRHFSSSLHNYLSTFSFYQSLPVFVQPESNLFAWMVLQAQQPPSVNRSGPDWMNVSLIPKLLRKLENAKSMDRESTKLASRPWCRFSRYPRFCRSFESVLSFPPTSACCDLPGSASPAFHPLPQQPGQSSLHCLNLLPPPPLSLAVQGHKSRVVGAGHQSTLLHLHSSSSSSSAVCCWIW